MTREAGLVSCGTCVVATILAQSIWDIEYGNAVAKSSSLQAHSSSDRFALKSPSNG